MTLQETIRKILREEYNPSGDEIVPNKFITHISSPTWRKNILLTGLQASIGDCYQDYAGGNEECKPAIFATNSTNDEDLFDSTWDDDIWMIDTEEIPEVKWYVDSHYDNKKHIVTFDNIPKSAIKLIYKGTGKTL